MSWVLTGFGNSVDSTNPYTCLVTGRGGSFGSGDLYGCTKRALNLGLQLVQINVTPGFHRTLH